MPKRVSVTLPDALVPYYNALPHHQRSKVVSTALQRYVQDHAPADVPLAATIADLQAQINVLQAALDTLRASVTNQS